jgi:hypothetical protein
MRQSPLRAFAQAAPLAVIPSILLTTPDQTPHRRRWQTLYWLSVNWKNAFGVLAGFRDYDDR